MLVMVKARKPFKIQSQGQEMLPRGQPQPPTMHIREQKGKEVSWRHRPKASAGQGSGADYSGAPGGTWAFSPTYCPTASRCTSCWLQARKADRGYDWAGALPVMLGLLPRAVPIWPVARLHRSPRALYGMDRSLIKFHTFEHIHHVLIKNFPSSLGMKESKPGCENGILKARQEDR
jgi:hypothetical protein